MANEWDVVSEAANESDEWSVVSELETPKEKGFIDSAMDFVGDKMNAVRDFATGAAPKKESVLQGIQMNVPAGMTDDVSVEENRYARDRSKSQNSVMFTKANAYDSTNAATAEGRETLAKKQKVVNAAAQTRDFGAAIDDLKNAYASGSAGAVALPINLIAPSSEFAEYLRGIQKDYESQISPEMQARHELMVDRINNEEGFAGKYIETISSLLTNPSLGMNEIVKQVPNFVGVLGASKFGSAIAGLGVRAAGMAAPGTIGIGEAISGGAIGTAAKSIGAQAGGLAGSVAMTAGDAAGNTYDELVKTNINVWRMNPDFRALVQSGVSEQDAIKQVATAKSRLAALAAAPLGLLGYAGAEASIIGGQAAKLAGKNAALQGFGKILAKDLIGENIEEGGTQFLSNLATRQVDQSKGALDGVAQAAATATIASGPMSGIAAYNETRPDAFVESFDHAGIAQQKLSPAAVLQASSGDEAIATAQAAVDSVSVRVPVAQITASVGSVDQVLQPLAPITRDSVIENQGPAIPLANETMNPIQRASDKDLLSRVEVVEQAQGLEPEILEQTGVQDGEQAERVPDAVATGEIGSRGFPPEGADIGGSGRVHDDDGARVGFQAELDSAAQKSPGTPVVKLGEPDEEAAKSLSGGVELTKQLFGDRADVRLFSDESPTSANGIYDQKRNIVWVNTKGVTFNALGTGWHEMHHVMQSVAEADDVLEQQAVDSGQKWTKTPVQKYRDRVDGIYTTMSLKGRAAYAGNFLYAAEANKSPEVQALLNGRAVSKLTPAERVQLTELRTKVGMRMLARNKLKREMMADFVGNRANDKVFIKSMAKADPVGFSNWAKSWIKAINDLLQSLRGNGKTYSDKVDSYIKDLEASRTAFQEALIELKSDTGATPVSIDGDIDFSRKGVIGEVAPHPGELATKEVDGSKVPKERSEMSPSEKVMDDKRRFAGRWDAQEDGEKEMANRAVAKRMFQSIIDRHRLKGWELSFSTGQYLGKTNPNFIIDAPEDTSPALMKMVANEIGYILDQQSMVVFDESNTSGENQNSFIKVTLPDGFPKGKLAELRALVADRFPRADSNTQFTQNELIFGNFTRFNGEALSDDEFKAAIDGAVEALDWDGEPITKEIVRYESELVWPENRRSYLKEDGNGKVNLEEVRPEGGRTILRDDKRNSLLEIRRSARVATTERANWIDNSVSGREYREASRKRLADATASTATAEVDYGTPISGSASAVGVHFSQQRRNVLTSLAFGTGIKGAELERLNQKYNADIKPRIYFYVDSGNGVMPEAGVGGAKHIVRLNNLYSTIDDKLGIVKGNTGSTQDMRNSNLERAVKKAGFDGYLADTGGSQRFAVLIGRHDIEMPQYQARDWNSVDDINDLGNFNLDRDFNDDKDFSEGPSIEELNAEIDAEEQAFRAKMAQRAKLKLKNPKDVTADEMKAHGLMPEKAMPFGDVTEDVDGISIHIPEGYKSRGQYEIIEQGDGYSVRTPDTFSNRNLPRELAIDHTKAMYAQPLIHASGYDLASAYNKGMVLKIASKWKQLATLNGIFKSDKISKADSVDDVFREIHPKSKYKVSVTGDKTHQVVVFKYTGTEFSAELESDGVNLKACTMGLDGSNLGTEFYAAVAQWATNRGLVFRADPVLSIVNTARRTEQAFSFALKSGKTWTLLPGRQNRVYGYNEEPKTEQDHLMNIGRLALAGMRNVMEIDPKIIGLSYNPNTDSFADKSGNDAQTQVGEFIKSKGARAFGIGRTTLARAVLTNQMIRGELGVVKEFSTPIAYQARGEDFDIGEGWGDKEGLNPKLKAFLGNSKIVRESGVPIVMYHGTARDIQTFNPKQANAIFVTYSPNFAEEFAGISGEWMESNFANELTPEQLASAKEQAVKSVMGDKQVKMSHRKEMALLIMSDKPTGEALDALKEAAKTHLPSTPNIIPLVVRAEHPFNFRNRSHVDEVLYALFNGEDKVTLTIDNKPETLDQDDVDIAIRSGMWEFIEAPEVQDVIRNELAHDSFFVMEAGQLNLAVYDRNQLKSAIGNNGNYDPEDDRIDFAKKAGPNEFGYEDNYLVPEIEGFFDDNSGSIATIPALVFQKDGIRRQYPSMMVRIQIGSHQRDKRGDFVKQYGLQHRIENRQEIPSARGYVTPDIGSESAQEVERAARDITLGVLDSQTAYADSSPTKVYLHAPTLNRSTVLEVKTDSSGEKFWSVVTSMPSTREQMMRRYKAPTSVVGTTLNGERTQQAFDIKLRILNRLKEPGQSPVTAEAYIIDEDGKLFHQNREKQLIPVVRKQPALLKRDANGKIILNKNKAPDFSRKQPSAQGLPEETRMQKVQRVMQDKYNRVKLIQDLLLDKGGVVGEEQDVYRAEERMHGRVHEVLRDFADDVVHPLIKKAVDYKIDLNELATYAYAKHAKERNAHIQKTNKNVKTGSGMSDQEADNIIQLVELSQDKDKFEELHADLLAITSTTRRLMLDEGLITQDQYDGLESQYENYVPLRGFEDVDPDSGSVRPGLGRGFQTKGKETIAAMGRDSKAGDIIENIIRDYERVTIRAERNAVGKTFLDLVTSNPDPKLWEVQPVTRATRKVNGLVEYVDVADKGDETISVKVAGEQVYIKINDPLLLRAMQNTFKAETSDAERFLANTLGTYTSLLRNTITRYNPAFGIINAVRDSQMGAAGVFDALGAEGLRRYAMNYGQAVAASGRVEFGRTDHQTHRMDKWMREMRFAGGTTGGVFMRDHETIRAELRDAMLQAGAKPNGVIEGIRSSKAWWATGKLLHGLELIGSMSENSARLAAYATAREMGKTPAQAASIAKNLTVNFNRFGEQGQLINTAYLFYNASVQGSVRIFQMAKNPKVRYAMAGMAAAGFGLAMMAAAVGGDDEDGQPYWDKIPDFEKERNLIIMLPPGMDIGEKVGTHGRYIKIPMAYGLNVFPVLGYQLADLARNASDPSKGISVAKAAINMVSAVAGSYNPAGGSLDPRDKVQLAMAVSPTIVDAGIQMGAGVDSFGKPTGPQKSPYDKRPDSENVSAQNHGNVNHRIARWINDVTGGNAARSGAIDIEPGTLKNMQGVLGGGLGKFVGDVVNLGYLGVMDVPIQPRDIPIYKAFYGEYDAKSGMSLFYERSKKALEEFDDMKSEQKLGIKRDYSDDEKFLQSMGAYAKNISEFTGKLKQQEVHVSESNSTPKEKDMKRRMIQRQREKMAEAFNAKWYEKESKLKKTGS